MAKITPSKRGVRDERETVRIKTKPDQIKGTESFRWWRAKSKTDMVQQSLATVEYLKTQQMFRYRQAAIYSRMYSNMPLWNFAGSSLNRMSISNSLPMDRPTMNIVQSCVDTKVSRITQNRPRPMFLTDNGHYRERMLAKEMNQFISGELYQTKAHQKGAALLRDAEVLGTGCWKVFRTLDNKVGLDRRFKMNLYVDPNDSWMGYPRQLWDVDLIDRSVLAEMFPQSEARIMRAEQAYPDTSGDSQKTVSDQVMIAEGWHLPSSEEAGDGRHVIICTEGDLLDEEYTKPRFPFVFLHSSDPLTGFWGQGCPERLMGTQIEINKLLITSSQAISLNGVPRVLIEDSSKIVSAHINNQIGSIIKYRGMPPQFITPESLNPEIYKQIERLIQLGYQQEGVSTLMAQGQKPAGLNSGEAQRTFENIQTDRFADLEKRYGQAFIDLSYLIIDTAVDIAKDTGKYQTVFPTKDGTKEVNLPDIAKLEKDPFVIQCYDTSSLPRDPSGRMSTIVERMQAGVYSLDTGRRMMGDLDLLEEDNLSDAPTNRILKQLDDIVENGKDAIPDPFTPLDIAQLKAVQYYNLYAALKLEESKLEKIRQYWVACQDQKMASMPAPAPGVPAPQGGPPIAQPQAPPTSDMLPVAS